jgi:acyl-CoA hydrolase
VRTQRRYPAGILGSQVAKLRGASIAERARRLIAIAHPDHRDQLRFDAQKAGLLH